MPSPRTADECAHPVDVDDAAVSVSSKKPANAVLREPGQTLWRPADDDEQPSITFDLGAVLEVAGVDVFTKNVRRVRIESSDDGVTFVRRIELPQGNDLIRPNRVDELRIPRAAVFAARFVRVVPVDVASFRESDQPRLAVRPVACEHVTTVSSAALDEGQPSCTPRRSLCHRVPRAKPRRRVVRPPSRRWKCHRPKCLASARYRHTFD